MSKIGQLILKGKCMRTKNVKNITQITRSYIFARPPIRECIARGLINNSALARLICKENSIRKFDAVHAACKRFEKDLSASFKKKAETILKAGEIQITHNISLITINRPRDMEKLMNIKRKIAQKKGKFNILDNGRSIQIIVSTRFSEEIKKDLHSHLIESHDFLSQLTLMLYNDGIQVPGVLAHLFSLLSYNGVNVIGEVCFNDDIRILLNKDDIIKAINIIGN